MSNPYEPYEPGHSGQEPDSGSDPANTPYGQQSASESSSQYGRQPSASDPYTQGAQSSGQPSASDPYGQQPQGYGQQPQGYGQPSASDPYGQQPGQPQPAAYGQQAAYGQPSPYGQPAYGQGGYAQGGVEHPKGTTCLVLGILGIVVCQVLGPIAYFQSKNALAEIDANPGVYSNRNLINIGKILGLVGTVLLGLGVIFSIIYVIVIVLAINVG